MTIGVNVINIFGLIYIITGAFLYDFDGSYADSGVNYVEKSFVKLAAEASKINGCLLLHGNPFLLGLKNLWD